MLKIVLLWWTIIVILSCFFNADFVPLSFDVKILLFVFTVNLFIGGFIAKFFVRKQINHIKKKYDTIEKINYFIYFLILYYGFQLILLIKYLLINGSDSLVYIRIIFFSDDYETNPFFINSFHLFIHRILIIPSILLLYIIGLKNHFFFNKNKIFFISIILLLIDSVIMFGRLNLYYMLLLYFFSAFIFSSYKSIFKFILDRIRIKNIFIISIFILVLLFFTILRSVEDSDFLTSSFSGFIDYNIIGFKIFDANLNNPSSIIHSHTFGRSLFGQVDSLFSILYRLIVDKGFLPANSENAKYLDTFIDLGLKDVKNVNAFGTVFFTLYRDFGYSGIILFPFFFGFLINLINLKFQRTKNPNYFMLGLFFIYSLTFSVYQSVFEGVFWPMFLILIFIIKFPKISFKTS